MQNGRLSLPSPALRTGAPWAAVLATAMAALVVGPAQAVAVANGTLLVAQELLQDPDFTATVVLVLRHDDGGTLGIVLNRKTSLRPGTVFPEVAELASGYEGVIYRGGPVQPTRLVYLVRGLGAVLADGPEIVDRVFAGGNLEKLPDIVKLGPGEATLRIFSGYATWAAGQLQTEIAAGSWRVIEGSSDLVFYPEPGRHWQDASAIAAAGLIAHHPGAADPANTLALGARQAAFSRPRRIVTAADPRDPR